MKLKNISYIEVQSDEDNESEKILYFHLINPPKIFRKINDSLKIKPEDNYVKKFSSVLDMITFTNHYHFEYSRFNKSTGRSINIKENLMVEHSKTTNQMVTKPSDEEVSFEWNNDYDYLNYIRIDSYLSIRPEFANFYLLNLVVRIKIKFYSKEEENDFFRELKFDNIIEFSNEIKPIPNEDTRKEVDNLLMRKSKSFYKYLLNLHFSLQYAVLSLITTKKLNIYSFDIAFLERLSNFNCDQQNEAALIIESMIKENSKLNSQNDLLQIFNTHWEKSFQNELMRIDDREKSNKDVMKTRTVEVTPNLIYYKPPAYEKQNHSLRKYTEYRDNFVKINFVDEDLSKIYFTSQSMWVLINFLKNVMLDGIVVGSRVFEFYAASNSQMKNSSYWFFNLEGTRFLEMEQIISELGDFSKELNIHKNAARRGQCLSTTSFVKKLNPNMIKRIDDLEKNNYCFTDGIGKISLDLAFECAKVFKMEYASAFQIRIGGVKGILAVDPEIREKESIHVRPSMIKFESTDTELGIIRCSSFSQGYLNRQIIVLLSSLGVPNSIFIDMALDELKKYDDIIESPELLNSDCYNKGDLLRKCYFFMPSLSYFCSSKLLEVKQDPFMSSLALNIAISKILDVKNKGKIYDHKSAVLIGVIDETNSLEEGEVFIQIKKEGPKKRGDQNKQRYNQEEDDDFKTVDCDVIVTKNPCLHPGDIKILRACNKYQKKLDHMLNVIVFSAKGKRPVQNEISGGDLDGDSFFVSWNEKLLNNIKRKNVKPMEETKGVSQHLKNKEIKRKDIVNSYIDYMKNDTIALISNAHLAFADSDPLGAFSEKCLKLSELFSIAIDAPKHGNFVSHDEFKKHGLLLKSYPDFLDSQISSTYKSPGVIGELFRLVNENDYLYLFDKNEWKFNFCQDYVMEPTFITENAHKYVGTAYQIYKLYQGEVKNMMRYSQVISETELFLSENMHDKKANKQTKQSDPYSELRTLRDKYTKKIIESLSKHTEGDLSRDVASAFYIVTYLNDMSLNKFKHILMPKYSELIKAMKKDGFLETNGSNESESRRKNYSDYHYFVENKTEYRRYNDIIDEKRIYSLPWLIREIREKLLKSKSGYYK